MVESQPKMPVYVMDLKMKFVRETKKIFTIFPTRRGYHLGAVKPYFTTIYLFISILYFVLGYYAFGFTL